MLPEATRSCGLDSPTVPPPPPHLQKKAATPRHPRKFCNATAQVPPVLIDLLSFRHSMIASTSFRRTSSGSSPLTAIGPNFRIWPSISSTLFLRHISQRSIFCLCFSICPYPFSGPQSASIPALARLLCIFTDLSLHVVRCCGSNGD